MTVLIQNSFCNMSKYRISVIGGWCGNRLIMVAEHIDQVLQDSGFSCQVKHHSVWENYTQPPSSDLVLQLLPAYTEEETNCPVINIKPLLADLDHPLTIDNILNHMQANYSQ